MDNNSRHYRRAAIKPVIMKALSATKVAHRREAQAAAIPIHPHIDTVYDVAGVAASGARVITVMVAGLKVPARMADPEGGLVGHALYDNQDGIILPAIKDNNGVLIKSLGGGSLSFFENALDALRAAVRIQKGMDEINMSKKFENPVLMRIGMHTGSCAVEANDISGEVAGAASSFESSADPGGILMSEDTYHALPDKAEIYCRFVKQVALKGKADALNAYKAFWNPQEIELDRGQESMRQEYVVPVRSSGMKLVWGAVTLIGIVLLLTLGIKFFGSAQQSESTRSISDSIRSEALEPQR